VPEEIADQHPQVAVHLPEMPTLLARPAQVIAPAQPRAGTVAEPGDDELPRDLLVAAALPGAADRLGPGGGDVGGYALQGGSRGIDMRSRRLATAPATLPS
jgi:hypothetical protein